VDICNVVTYWCISMNLLTSRCQNNEWYYIVEKCYENSSLE
jgi:hypothetical protein